MKRLLIGILLVLLGVPAYAQQWDQVNGSTQVKSGPTAPLVIIDQTNTGQKILSLRNNGTEKCYVDTSGNLNCVGTFTLTAGTLDWSSGVAGSSSDVSLSREAAGHLFQRNSTNAQRASWANTYTSSTNYEAFSVDWQTTANTALVGTRTAATGTTRPLQFGVQGSSAAAEYAAIRFQRSAAPFVNAGVFDASGNTVTVGNAGSFIQLGTLTSNVTSSQVNVVAITPTYNQSSGTAANTDLLINRTETAVGSGSQRLIDLQTGGTSRFYITAGGASGRATQEVFTQNTAPTCTSANNCGTGNGTFATGSSDVAGSVTLGTTPASGFIITFNGTWAAAPVCNVWMNKAGMVVGKMPLTTVTSTTTITVVTNGTAPATGDIYAYRCTGLQ